MLVIKKDGKEKEFDIIKIKVGIEKANKSTNELLPDDINKVSNYVFNECNKIRRSINVAEIQDIVENALMKYNYFETAKAYIKYRYQKILNKKQNTIDNQVLSTVNLENEEVKQENSNKNPTIIPTQRDYIAGIVSKDLTNRYLLPKDVVEAHDKGLIHFHDADYFIQKSHNCDLVNLEDMLQNGTVINGVEIEKPHSFLTACTIMTQIMAIVASCQYGGQTMTLAHIAPFVAVSREKIKKDVEEELKDIDYDDNLISTITEKRLKDEIKKGVQTIQYQILTLNSTNGQTPFVSLNMYLNEAKTEQEKNDLALIIEEVLKQRIQGVKNEQGVWITPAFPKLLYVLEEDNIEEGQPYYYLTELAAKCTAKRMVPDYISEKIMLELKGDCYPCMGAAAEDETVSIKINDQEYKDIKIKDAYDMINKETRYQETISGFNTRKYIGQPAKTFDNVCGVYKLTHTPTGLFYVGSSKNIGRRYREHRVAFKHKGTLGDNYFIDDYNLNNIHLEILESCDINDLLKVESKYVDFKNKDSKCVNQKDPIKNGNFDSITRELALQHISYSNYINKGFTWIKKITTPDILIKSNNEYVPIRAIMKNFLTSPLKLYEIKYEKNNEIKSLFITEDHPLATTRGRIRADNLKIGDEIFDAVDLNIKYKITDVLISSRKVETYDFETDNDKFDLSGIISHNCRSFLTPDRFTETNVGNITNAKNYIPGKHIYYGRFNQGVCSVNLPFVACESKKNLDKFWKKLDETCELAHKALRVRHEHLLGTPSDVAPLLWQYGALARLNKGEKIDKLLYNGYSTISLGYAGLWECVYSLIGEDLTSTDGKELGLKIMKFLNDKCSEWKRNENIDYSVYGTPLESTTYKFAKSLQEHFGIIKGVSDKNYITNSYHIHVSKHINAFDKLEFESEFQKLSPGGAISYVEVPDLLGNTKAVLSLIKFIYNNIMYAELNTKSDYCQCCGYDGQIQIIEDENHKLIWKCPQCGNTDQSRMNIARRTCGYIGTQGWNQGRTQEIKDRVLHL